MTVDDKHGLLEPLQEVAADAQLFDVHIERIRKIFRERNNVYKSSFREAGFATVLAWIHAKMRRVAAVLRGDDTRLDEDVAENLHDLAIYSILAAILSEQTDNTYECSHLFKKEFDKITCIVCGTSEKIISQ